MNTGNGNFGLDRSSTNGRERFSMASSVTAGPQLECRQCHLPILLAFVVRDGDRRMIDCPVCAYHDEWSIASS